MITHEDNGLKVVVKDGEVVITYHDSNLPGRENDFCQIKIETTLFGGLKVNADHDATRIGNIYGNEVIYQKTY